MFPTWLVRNVRITHYTFIEFIHSLKSDLVLSFFWNVTEELINIPPINN